MVYGVVATKICSFTISSPREGRRRQESWGNREEGIMSILAHSSATASVSVRKKRHVRMHLTSHRLSHIGAIDTNEQSRGLEVDDLDES
ncbi:predicted protein [Plenodomus lingam JN3]|uniref:Predicted protein n=1 Tax=Leptosphaeria maculans (strain JN3 / isolate v23.1.3 / race Av1-4-5-6-7-8) TaxID=985895 RepID=E5A1V7_LEPMJ|nr:predicted protein [Plenodomus lingam JN3]CBX97674.1 predicted protein [Plenodomus lingam JN3]